MNIEQTIKEYPNKHPLGFTINEIRDLLTNFKGIHLHHISERLLTCQIGEQNGKKVYYSKDVTKLIKGERLKQIINVKQEA